MATRRKPRTGTAKLPVATVIEPEIRAVSGWTVSRIDLARRSADAGDLEYAADLWERVMSDERAFGPLSALVGIVALPLSFLPPGADPDDPEAGADDPQCQALEEDWWTAYPEDILGEIIRWSIGLGVAVVQTTGWTLDEQTGRVVPTKVVWHPRNVRQRGGEWQVRQAGSAEWRAISPGDGEWEVITPYGRKRPWARAPWYGLGLLWFAAQCAKIDWADWNESHAKPIKAAANEKAETHGLLDDLAAGALARKIASLVRGGAIVLPDGYRLQLLEATSANWQSLAKLCDEVWPKAVAIALTGNNLTTQIEGGSFAAATVAAGVEQARKRLVAETLSTTLRTQGVVWWSEFNFGDRFGAPWPRWDVRPPRDLTAAASRAAQGAQTLATLESAGWEPESEQEVEELVGLKLRRKAKPPAPKVPPAAPPPPPADSETEDDGEEDDAPVGDKGASEKGARALPAGESFDAEAFIDALEAQAIEAGAAAIRPELAAVLGMIRDASDLRDLERKLAEHFAALDPAPFAAVVERAMLLAVLAGRHSGNVDP